MNAMRWHRTRVGGRTAGYGLTGPERSRVTNDSGTVVFLHGWALSDRTYRRGLEQLAEQGYRVLSPALPGFGATADMDSTEFSVAGYAAWLVDLLDVLQVRAPVTLVGHSFGGAVAIQCAHDPPERVARLVLVNSIGGSTWSSEGRLRAMSERPWGDWGVHLGAELLSARGLTRVLPVVAADALTHALLRPRTLWRVGRLAREADLGIELEELRRRRTPVAILWGREDTVLPWACAESLISALGDPQVVTVDGDHGWLIGDPGRFVEVLTNVLGVVGAPDDGEVA